MLFRYTVAEFLIYGWMLVLIAAAVGHWIEGRSLARRLGKVERKLRDALASLRHGGCPNDALRFARDAAGGFPLAEVFDARLRAPALARERLGEAVRLMFQPLHDAAAHNELAAPRWGFLFTVLGITTALAAASHGGGSAFSVPLASVGMAFITTVMGIGVAIREAQTVRGLVVVADRLGEVSTAILVEVARSRDRQPLREVGHET